MGGGSFGDSHSDSDSDSDFDYDDDSYTGTYGSEGDDDLASADAGGLSSLGDTSSKSGGSNVELDVSVEGEPTEVELSVDDPAAFCADPVKLQEVADAFVEVTHRQSQVVSCIGDAWRRLQVSGRGAGPAASAQGPQLSRALDSISLLELQAALDRHAAGARVRLHRLRVRLEAPAASAPVLEAREANAPALQDLYISDKSHAQGSPRAVAALAAPGALAVATAVAMALLAFAALVATLRSGRQQVACCGRQMPLATTEEDSELPASEAE